MNSLTYIISPSIGPSDKKFWFYLNKVQDLSNENEKRKKKAPEELCSVE